MYHLPCFRLHALWRNARGVRLVREAGRPLGQPELVQVDVERLGLVLQVGLQPLADRLQGLKLGVGVLAPWKEIK